MNDFAFAQIEPVGQCNLRCQMCPIQFRQDGPPYGPLAFMSYEIFCRLIDDMPALKSLHLQGMGEPLMHPQFFEMVQYAVARGVRVSTNSNLTLLSERRARSLVESGLSELSVSLDGATRTTYENIRLGARFSKVTRHLAKLLELRAASSSPLSVRVVTVAMRENVHELPELVALVHALGADSLFVQHLCHEYGESNLPVAYAPMKDFVDDQSLLYKEAREAQKHFAAARLRAQELGVDLRLPRLEREPRGCDWPWRGPYISYRGEAMPCCMVGTPDRLNFGDMVKLGVAPVWNGTAYTAFRAALASEKPPDICRSCAVYQGVF